MKLNNKRTIYVGLAFMSICAFWQVYDTVIPLILEKTFEMNHTTIGVVMAADNVLALVLLPLFGMLSDKTRTKIGRRMPYILVGTALALISMYLLPFAQAQNNMIMFLVGLGLVLLSMAIYRSPAVALMPDVTPKPLRSKGNAIINLTGALGGMLMLVAMIIFPVTGNGDTEMVIFIILGTLMALCIAVLFWKIKEPQSIEDMKRECAEQGIAIDDGKSIDAKALESDEKMSAPIFKSFMFLLSSIFLWFFGYNAVVSAFSRYAESELDGNFANVLLVCSAAAIVAYIPVGHIAVRIGRKKTILMGVTMLAISFAAGIFFREVTMLLYVFFALAGFGWAFINVNSYPMVVEMSGGYDVGKYTGYYYTVSMSAQVITPMLSGFLMDTINMRVLFPYATIFVVLSFVTMLFVRHGDSKPQPKKGLEVADVDD